ncbi:MAG: hypothetical protein AAF362_06455 [Pseudomonadota bacterium]
MFTEARYNQYILDFNSTFDGKMTLEAFFDTYYEPDATFEYVPQGRKNIGRGEVLEFWRGVGGKMKEVILDHTHFLENETTVASEAPIDFLCNEDLEWNGVSYKRDRNSDL